MADLQRFIPRQGSDPSGRVAARHEAAVSAHSAHGDHVGKHRQPDGGDTAVDHFAYGLRRYRRHLPAAHVARPAGDRLNPLFFRPAMDVVLNRLGCLDRIVSGNALEEQPFHLRQGCAPGERERILLALMGVAMDVDGVFDLDIRRVDDAGLVLRARGVGGHAAFVSRGGNYIFGHGVFLL